MLQNSVGRIVAGLGSVAAHAALLTWLALPLPLAHLPAQQVIDVELVSPAQPLPAPERNVAKNGAAQHVRAPATSRPFAAPVFSSSRVVEHATPILTAVTQPVYDAAYLHNPPPAYPEAARFKGLEGEVLLDVAVTTSGQAGEVAIARSSGYGVLDKAASEAIRQWRFIPARRGAELVEAKVGIPISFRLDE